MHPHFLQDLTKPNHKMHLHEESHDHGQLFLFDLEFLSQEKGHHVHTKFRRQLTGRKKFIFKTITLF